MSIKEQLSFFLRTVNQDLNPFEDFMGFYELENTKSDTITCVIKDILSRTHLILDHWKVQTYDDVRRFRCWLDHCAYASKKITMMLIT